MFGAAAGAPCAAAADSGGARSGGAGAGGGGGGTARLKGGGEDAGGRALTLSLLHAVLEAAATEVTGEDEAVAGQLQSADGQAAGDAGLDPVASGKTASPVALAAARAPPEATGRLGSLKGVASRLGVSAVSSAAALLGGTPTSPSAAPAVDAVAAARKRSPSPEPTASGDSGTGAAAAAATGSSRLSLAWVQEQFARGLSVSSSTGSTARAGAAAAGEAAKTAEAASSSEVAPSSPASHPAASDPPTSSSTPPTEPWPLGLPDRLRLRRSIRLQQDPLTAVALSSAPLLGKSASPGGSPHNTADAAGIACCVGHAGLLRVLGAPGLGALRSSKLQQEEDLLSLCLFQAPRAHHHAQPHGAAAPDAIMLAGSANRMVFAFSPQAGRMLGSWAAHEDAVSVVLPLGCGGGGGGAPGAPARLLTASWDCGLKVWDVAEGRQPWDTSVPLASCELRDFESGIWAAAGSSSGQLVVTGTEEGVVAAWDLRSGRRAWSSKVSGDYVGGLALLPGGAYVAAVSADGAVRLLEWRRGGDVAVTSHCGAPLRCCASDGRLLVAGGETGQLALWDAAAMTGQARPAEGFAMPGPDGFYRPLTCESRAPVNGVAVLPAAAGAAGGCWVAAAQDDGTLALFSA